MDRGTGIFFLMIAFGAAFVGIAIALGAIGYGAQAGGFSPISVYGVTVNDIVEQAKHIVLAEANAEFFVKLAQRGLRGMIDAYYEARGLDAAGPVERERGGPSRAARCTFTARSAMASAFTFLSF